MHYKIIADSCCDYVQQGEDILSFVTRVPLSIDLDGRTFIDDASLDCTAFLADMAKSRTAPRSACPSPMAFAEACKGPEQDIYIVTLSAKVSGTFDSAYTGAQMAMAADPEKHVHVFNSHSAAAGEVALCLKLQELAQQGLSFQEVVEAGEAYVAGLTTDFVLEDLDVFRKNGRLNHLQAIATSGSERSGIRACGTASPGAIRVGNSASRSITSRVAHSMSREGKWRLSRSSRLVRSVLPSGAFA